MIKYLFFTCVLLGQIACLNAFEVVSQADLGQVVLEAHGPKLKSAKDSTPLPIPLKKTDDLPNEALYFSEINLTQMRLQNGLTIWLKPTQFDHDEVYVNMTAVGGYGSMSNADRPSGELASSIAWESGLGGLNTDQLTVLLHDNSLEFNPKIYPFKRAIEGTADTTRIGVFFDCIKMVFTQQKFTAEGFKEALLRAKESLSKASIDIDAQYETEFLKVNTRGVKALKPLALDDLDRVNFEKAKTFYDRAFSDPSEFVLVIVGDFDVKQVLELAHRHLGAIPRKRGPNEFTQSVATMFPPGITSVETVIPRRVDTVTRMTFPWKKTMSERKYYKMAITCQIIKARLKTVISEKFKKSYGIDVSYEFPFYPFLENPWITIKFRCEGHCLDEIKGVILAELKQLQENGIDLNELDQIKSLEAGRDEFRMSDNFYWTAMLGNYYLWDWDPQWIYRSSKLTQEITVDKVNWILKTAFSLENYSTVTATPPKTLFGDL